MPTRSQHVAVAGFLTIATFAITSGIQRSPGIPAQLSRQPINVYSEAEAAGGITIRANEHNIFICPQGTESRVALESLEATAARFWVYQYSRQEPAITGSFYMSPGELAVHPQYSSLDTLRRITGGERYYVMSSVTLQFACGAGLSKVAACGDGFVDAGTEQCDDGNGTPSDGCSRCTRDFCEDSDNGERFDVRGETRANAGETLTATDTCSGNPGEENMLYEYSCTASKTIATKRTVCPHGCRNGACVAGPVCGNGILEQGETCDVVHEGCNQRTCAAMNGYVCRSNVCEVYIPTIDGSTGGATGGDGGQEGPTQGIVLHSANITGAMFGIEYSKDFENCAHVYTRDGFAGQRSNFACRTGNNVAAQIPVSDFASTAGIRVGTAIKLCDGNDSEHCSGFVQIQQGGDGREADVSVEMEAPTSVPKDTPALYVVTVRNAGPVAAEGVQIQLGVPGGSTFRSSDSHASCTIQAAAVVTCRLGTLAAGASITVPISVQLNLACNATTNMRARMTSTVTDPVLENNTSSVTTTRATCASSDAGDTSGKIVSVVNANPDADYSAIPTGLSSVGQFKFTAASGDAQHPRGKAEVGALLFTVDAQNAVIATANGRIRIFNKKDATMKETCAALYPDGSPYTATSISGKFFVVCEGLRESQVDTEIDPGESQTFVLELNVINPQLNESVPATLQVSLENINLQTTVFGARQGNSHVRWFSLGTGGSTERLRFDIPTSVVKSTLYMSE